ncbi:hypothetical protein K466DRAFT_345238 [Polyporus arcularius HHB13444]|uniref:Uncharacterized protein n=1 Tax=Polyporus arcularius HHB13444 TaxID=1314778 RepID=A0A5C3PMR2_9APHY|nr:hypothetical protein K466DRAFT_345238 [Polyporus arcularius HHB13444]
MHVDMRAVRTVAPLDLPVARVCSRTIASGKCTRCAACDELRRSLRAAKLGMICSRSFRRFSYVAVRYARAMPIFRDDLEAVAKLCPGFRRPGYCSRGLRVYALCLDRSVAAVVIALLLMSVGTNVYGATQAEPTSAASPVLLLVAQLMSTYASRT